jgi:hypothetical protein
MSETDAKPVREATDGGRREERPPSMSWEDTAEAPGKVG